MIWDITLIIAPITSIIVTIILNEYYKKKLKQNLIDKASSIEGQMFLTRKELEETLKWYKKQPKDPNYIGDQRDWTTTPNGITHKAPETVIINRIKYKLFQTQTASVTDNNNRLHIWPVSGASVILSVYNSLENQLEVHEYIPE